MRTRAFGSICLAYVAALAAAAVPVSIVPAETALMRAFWADIVATLVIFGFSKAHDNSSFYDAYWSVAPIPIAIYWWWLPEAGGADSLRQLVVLVLVNAWAARLTYNWARGWSGLDHEDWRYVDMREKVGGLYWAVSLIGLHMMPTLFVFAGCLTLWPALVTGTQPFGAIDVVASVLTGGAILLEGTADNQLRGFRLSNPPPTATLDTGVWSYVRHPNYLGEIGFWWGLFLFALAAEPQAWWTGVGALSITLLFRFASLKLIDDRMVARRPDYEARMKAVPALIPRLRSFDAEEVS